MSVRRYFFTSSFGRLLLKRAIQSVVLIFVLVVLNFLLIHIAPGDPVHVLAGQSADEKYYEFIRAKFGLDQPILKQLWIYLRSVFGGDLGYSLSYQQPVIEIILERVPATLILMLSALLVSTVAGVVLGVESARRENSFADRATNTFALLGHSIPSFSIGHLMLIVFALYLGLFPAQNMHSANQELSGLNYLIDVANHLVLPAATLSIVYLAQIMRLTRTSMLNVLRENFITAVRAKGVSEGRIAYRHALRNAMLPILTVVGNDLGMLLSGAVFVETVFAWPGLGRLMIDSLAMRDYPLLMALFLIVSVSVALANFATDVGYALLDPRISYGRFKR